MIRWVRSDELVPEGHIRVTEAFEAYYQKITLNWGGLDAAIGAADSRRTSAEKAPKVSAWKPAADGPLSKTEEDNFLRTLSETERAFWKAERAFHAAVKAREDARENAARKFIAAVAAGELRPLTRRKGSNREFLKPWDKVNDVVPLLCECDAVIDGGRPRPIFFPADRFKSWLTEQGATSVSTAAPKVMGLHGGRPTSMPAIKAELGQWIAGGTKLVLAQMQRWAPMDGDTRTKGRLALALSNWDDKRTAPGTIQKTLSKELDKALALII